MTGKITARDVRGLLRKRFDSSRYSVMEEVGNATGSMQTRRLDMVVVSVWPSDGYTIEGIEVKVSKSDLKHELESPQKHNVFFASIVRNLHAESPGKKIVLDAERRGYERGRRDADSGWELRNAREQIKRQNKELAAFRAHYFIDGRFAGDTLKGRANKLAAMDRLGYLPGTVADLRILSNELGKMADLIEGEV